MIGFILHRLPVLAVPSLLLCACPRQGELRGIKKTELSRETANRPLGKAPSPASTAAALESIYRARRLNMVRNQIKSRNILDRLVLKAMGKVPRHRFVPLDRRKLAYRDHPLPIGHRQTISQPYIVAFMTDALRLKGRERVLEIGTGSGYQAAVLAEIVKEVYSIEIVGPLALRAKKTLHKLKYRNIFVRHGDGYRGWPEKAPFDAIIITAAPPVIPKPLLKQLKVGGRMILPLGTLWQELILLTRTAGGFSRRKLLPVRFVPMTGEVQRPRPH